MVAFVLVGHVVAGSNYLLSRKVPGRRVRKIPFIPQKSFVKLNIDISKS